MSWNLYFQNTTEQPISFVIFQENSILDQDSYSAVWHKGTAQKGEKVGPISLPSEISVSVHPKDSAFFDVAPQLFRRGETWTYDSAANIVTLTSSDEDVVDPELENAKDNKTEIDAIVWKNNAKVLTQKNIAPGESLELAVSPKIFVVESGNLKEGDEFQVLTLEQAPAAYELSEGEITIVAKQENGKVVFA